MTTTRSSFLCASISVLMFLTAPASAADAVVEAATGEVMVWHKKEGRNVRADAGEEFSYGDEVRTLKGAKAHIVFSDGISVIVRERSFFGLSGYAKRPFLSFFMGEFLVGFRKGATPVQELTLRTPAAVVKVRGGSDFLLKGVSSSENKALYVCLAGEAEVTADERSVPIGAGDSVEVVYGKSPELPDTADAQARDLSDFRIGGSLKGLGSLLESPGTEKAPE